MMAQDSGMSYEFRAVMCNGSVYLSPCYESYDSRLKFKGAFRWCHKLSCMSTGSIQSKGSIPKSTTV